MLDEEEKVESRPVGRGSSGGSEPLTRWASQALRIGTMTCSVPQNCPGSRAGALGAVFIVAGVLIAFVAAALSVYAAERTVIRDRGQPPEVARETPMGDLYALVVGVSQYRHAAIPALKFAAKDAGDFGAFLAAQKKLFRNVHVKLLTDAQATRHEIEKFLFYDLLKAGKDDSVIMYFSGHGAIDPKRAEEYFFCAHDTDPEYLAATAVLLSGPRFLGNLSSRHVLVVSDTCHAGGLSNLQTKSLPVSFQSFLQEFQQSSGRIIIASSKPGEFSMEQERLQNSVFSHFFLEGLRGPADKDRDGAVTVREAYEYAYDRTKDATQGAQHPVFEGRLVGKFPLAFVKRAEGVVELFTEPPLTEVYMRAERGFKLMGKSDESGRIALNKLPADKPFIFMLKKRGWIDKILDPVSLTDERPRIKLARVQLDPAQSFLVLNAYEAGVKVRIGDKEAGETGEDSLLVVDNVQVGIPHKVLLSKPGFDDKAVTLTIPESYEGRTFTWSQQLKVRKPTKPQHIEALVTTDPPDVEVYVGDGSKPVGVTGTGGGLKVLVGAPGKVAFRFRKENFEPKVVEYEVTADQSRSLPKVVMKRIKSDLLLHTEPGHVPVSVNGKHYGATDAQGQLLVKGVDVDKTLNLGFVKDGYASLTREVKVPSVPLYRMEPVRLNLLTGSLVLSADPPSAEVSIASAGGYKFAGKTDALGVLSVNDIPVGTQLFMTITKAGWKAVQVGPVACSADKLRIELPKVNLERAVASLLLKTVAARVNVEINGALVGETGDNKTLKVDDVPVGVPHEITLRKEGFQERKFAVNIPVSSAEKVHATPLIHLDKAPTAQGPQKPASGDQAGSGASRVDAKGPEQPGATASTPPPRPARDTGRPEERARVEEIAPSPARPDPEPSRPEATGMPARARASQGIWLESSPDTGTAPARGVSAPSGPEVTGMPARARSSGGGWIEPTLTLPGD